MTITLDLYAACECGYRLHGIKVATVERVLVNSIRIASSLSMWHPCPECGFNGGRHTEPQRESIRPADQAAIDARRERLRASRKKAA